MRLQRAGIAARYFWRIVSGAAFEWSEDKAPRMAAAIAFYTVFSLTPIVVIAIAIAGVFASPERAREEILDQAKFLIGDEGAEAIELLLANAPKRERNPWATVLGLATILFAATGAFTELKDSINTIWEVQPKPGLGIVEMVRDRILSFAMVLVIGFLLLVSLVASAALSALSRTVSVYMTEQVQILQMGNFLISLLVITVLFALIYRILPDAEVAWRDVWFGAGLVAVLFVIGKSAFGLYLGLSTLRFQYGAAGSLVIVVLWTYYTCLILLFGAEMSQVQARLRGVRIRPAEKAVHLTEHDRIQQGAPHEREVVLSMLDAGEQPPPPAACNRRSFIGLTCGLAGFFLGWLAALLLR